MNLEAAIFDLGGVLTTPILASFVAFDREHGLPEGTLAGIFRDSYTRAEESDFHLLETGQLTEAEYYRRLALAIRDRCGVEIALPEDPRAVRRSLFATVRPNEDMIEAARRIKRHYRVGLLTNNVREWGGWREYYPQDLFEVVVDSCEVGVRKPSPRIYQITLERLGVAPERAAFVDDIPENVRGAESVGMTGIHFTETEAVLARLRELFPLAFAGEVEESRA